MLGATLPIPTVPAVANKPQPKRVLPLSFSLLFCWLVPRKTLDLPGIASSNTWVLQRGRLRELRINEQYQEM